MNLKDVIFEPKHTPEQLEMAINWLKDTSVKDRYFYAANFGIVATDRNFVTEFINQPCHREIQGNEIPDRALVATECGWGRRHETLRKGSEEIFQPFFDWLTKESFVSRFILWSSLKDGFVVSADMYTPLLQNIMIITRHFYEAHLNAFLAFNKMISDGVPGDIAYPMTFNSSLSSNAPLESKFISVYGHRVTHLFGLDEFKRFVQGEIGAYTKDDLNDPRNHYRVRRNYMGGKEMFWNSEVVAYSSNFSYGDRLISSLLEIEEFRDGLSQRRKTNNKEMYKAPNPFAPKSSAPRLPAANEVSNEEARDYVAPFLAKYLAPYRKESQHG